ncbi:Branched-chain amino acid aminotransferase/4-amino-4-deoxychorismate lyase [Halalkaliarchaeum sp. AArc-CO]|uniref:aminotransferase class IV n=1 Tax=unclassified Halalkaliarchaeum TaxID=2678344 RepID=UPI00217DC44F|nr:MULTISPECIES: aminotransferase class IV [unclassified Halalkaliarchaeum]MDR5672685.1 aminotransferase class IV [Halalkaliarchaeum sp. AArc-GB]UWG49410.1 Branched-chain amino acid aminotransferase/4-amino-4-deoxychorismate lyase [Halalkaliarchaeum sp. AArc-CO]
MSDDRSAETRTDGGPESLTYHVDGELVSADEASVAVNDRGFMYGDAAFETLRAYGGDLFRWGDHAERLANTCETLELDHGLADEDLRARIDETLAANDLEEAYVRLSITRGVQPGKLTPDPEVDPTVVVIAKPLPRGGRPDRGGEPRWDGPASLRTVDVRRPPENVMPSHLKTHNYLGGILARLALRGTDADEALLCDVEGNVAEGTTSNVFFVDDRALHTPSLEGPVLPGVTRQVVLELAREEGIPVDEGTFSPADVRAADEVFITNTTGEVWPVASIDGDPVDPAESERSDSQGSDATYPGGPVTRLLARLFDERIESEFY